MACQGFGAIEAIDRKQSTVPYIQYTIYILSVPLPASWPRDPKSLSLPPRSLWGLY